MSDYLTNLIVRNREESLTVRPRLTSLFEPVRGSTLFFETGQVGDDSDILVSRANEKTSTRDSNPIETSAPLREMLQSGFDENSSAKLDAAPQPDKNQGDSTIRPTREERRNIEAKVSEPTESSSPVALTPKLIIPKPEVEPRKIESSAIGETSGKEKSNQGRTDTAQETTQVIATVIGHLAAPPRTKERNLPSASVEPNFAKPVAAEVRPDKAPSPKARSITNAELSPLAPTHIAKTIRPERAEPVVEGRAPARSSEPFTPSLVVKPTAANVPIVPRVTTSAPPTPESIRVESPEPIINVTIGRVEVRAAPAMTATTKPPDSRSKLMSLDDYLQQRAQGGRP